MDSSHIHLMLNHIPILGSVFAAILLCIGMLLKNRSVEITALSTLLLVSLITLPVYFSGEESEEKVEHMANISEHDLEEHEEHAELTLTLMLVAGGLALTTLASYKFWAKSTRFLRLATLGMSLIAFLTAVPLALHGGKIVHPELREGSQH